MNEPQGANEIHYRFEDLMKGELKYTVESQDAETGINKLIDTMKKQHVRNFTMHQELMAALQTKIHMDTWRD